MTYIPQQNDIAKRMNMILLNKDRYILLSSGLPKLFSGANVKIAAYLVNMSLISALNFNMLKSIWTQNSVNYS